MCSFDPYHKWLGIPPKEQPANHYRLLGITLFEDDPDVIQSAADQRMAFVQSCATGEHVAESQQVLNDLAAARACLLDPAKRSRYNSSQQQQANPVVDEAPPHRLTISVAGASTHEQASPVESTDAAPELPPPTSDQIAAAFHRHDYVDVVAQTQRIPVERRTAAEREWLQLALHRVESKAALTRNLDSPPSGQRKLELFQQLKALMTDLPTDPEVHKLTTRYCRKYGLDIEVVEHSIMVDRIASRIPARRWRSGLVIAGVTLGPVIAWFVWHSFVAHREGSPNGRHAASGVERRTSQTGGDDTAAYTSRPGQTHPYAGRVPGPDRIPSGDPGRTAASTGSDTSSQSEDSRLELASNYECHEQSLLVIPLRLPGNRTLPSTVEVRPLGKLPAGCRIDPRTNVLVWTPAEEQGPGRYNLSLALYSNEADIPLDTVTVQVDVLEVPQPLQLSTVGGLSGTVGETVRHKLKGVDLDLPTPGLEYGLDPKASDDFQIDSSTGSLRWTPSQAGRVLVRVSVERRGDADSRVWRTIRCMAAPQGPLPAPTIVGGPVHFLRTPDDKYKSLRVAIELDHRAVAYEIQVCHLESADRSAEQFVWLPPKTKEFARKDQLRWERTWAYEKILRVPGISLLTSEDYTIMRYRFRAIDADNSPGDPGPWAIYLNYPDKKSIWNESSREILDLYNAARRHIDEESGVGWDPDEFN